MSEYTDLYKTMTDHEYHPSVFFDTAREKYQADLLDEAEDEVYHLKAWIAVLGAFLACAVIVIASLVGGAL